MGAVLDSSDLALVRGMGHVQPLTAGLSGPLTLDWTAQLCLVVGPLLFSLGPGLGSSALAEMGLHSFSILFCLFYLFIQPIGLGFFSSLKENDRREFTQG